jgi:hypothetical protein
VPLSEAETINLLKSLKGEAPTTYSKVWIQLHTGDPGSAGTANVAGESKRKEATLTGTATLSNSGVVKWTEVSTAETYKYFSVWSAESGGTFIGKEPLEAEKAVSAKDHAEFAAGTLTLTIGHA